MNNPNDIVQNKHLEAAVQASKTFALEQLGNFNGGSASFADFTGAGLSVAGLSGLVPAPQIGDEEKFLCGNGSWMPFTLGTLSSTVNGAFWLEE